MELFPVVQIVGVILIHVRGGLQPQNVLGSKRSRLRVTQRNQAAKDDHPLKIL